MTLTIAAAIALVAVGGGGAVDSRLVHVSVIGDSVPSSMGYDAKAFEILGQGIDLYFDAVPCRRIDVTSCTPTGASTPPLTVVQMAQSGLPLGPVSVIVCGHNDKQQIFAQEIDHTLAALKADGVKRVLWLTMRETRSVYPSMNADLLAAAASSPDLTVLDWNSYSRSHPEWFGDDGLHLAGNGPQVMAAFIHAGLIAAKIAVPSVAVRTNRLPPARLGVAYHATLAAVGGLTPVTWSLAAAPPSGIHLRHNDLLMGRPSGSPGTYPVIVTVRDASGTSATRTLGLTVRR